LLGSGSVCDATYLFSADLLGENREHIPRHAKVYRNFAAQRDQMQRERVAAYQEYISDIESQSYPSNTHDVSINANEFDQFLSEMESN
jgi:3-methyl-2-oxobutanoate hydroxymethyltransferase